MFDLCEINSGAAGRNFKLMTLKTLGKERLIPYITGLDPANPCFNNGEVLTGLFR